MSEASGIVQLHTDDGGVYRIMGDAEVVAAMVTGPGPFGIVKGDSPGDGTDVVVIASRVVAVTEETADA